MTGSRIRRICHCRRLASRVHDSVTIEHVDVLRDRLGYGAQVPHGYVTRNSMMKPGMFRNVIVSPFACGIVQRRDIGVLRRQTNEQRRQRQHVTAELGGAPMREPRARRERMTMLSKVVPLRRRYLDSQASIARFQRAHPALPPPDDAALTWHRSRR
jgi:hypothetical protein